MSGPSWPTVGVQPTSLPEHATQLKHEATRLQAFVNPKTKEDKLSKVLQWAYIEPFVRSVQNFAERVLNQSGTAQIELTWKPYDEP